MIYIVLYGMGGELDRKPVTEELEIDNVMGEAIREWTFNVGDTIKVVEETD